MCWRYAVSSRFIDHTDLFENAVPQIWVDGRLRGEIDFSAHRLGEVPFEANEGKESFRLAEPHEQVDVTLRLHLAPRGRAEHADHFHIVATAYFHESVCIERIQVQGTALGEILHQMTGQLRV